MKKALAIMLIAALILIAAVSAKPVDIPSIPPIDRPQMNTPSMNIPPMNTPSMNIPPMNTPSMNIPPMNTPVLPNIKMPDMPDQALFEVPPLFQADYDPIIDPELVPRLTPVNPDEYYSDL